MCVSNKIINTSQCSRLNSFVKTINNANELIQLLLLFDDSKRCAGNVDEKFLLIWCCISHKRIFKNQQGLLYIAVYIANYMHSYS